MFGGRRLATPVAKGLIVILGALAGVLVVTVASSPNQTATEAAADGGQADDPGVGRTAEPEGVDIAQVIQDGQQAQLEAQFDPSLAEASLDALRENGALPESGDDSELEAGAATEPVLGFVHTVRCLPESCDQIAQWGTANGFRASAPVLTLGHGGAEEFHIELRHALPADATAITTSAEQVAVAVQSLTDSEVLDLAYDGWAPELISTEVAGD